MKCSFCKKKSTLSCNFYKQDGTVEIIQGCDEHWSLAYHKQQMVKIYDDLKHSWQKHVSHE